MTFQRLAALKVRGNDLDAEMALSILGAFVPGMQVTFIDDLELDRCKGALQG
jgi:hypothetical protein